MKLEDLFLCLVITALTIYLFYTGDSTLCAIGTMCALFSVMCWYKFLEDVGKNKEK